MTPTLEQFIKSHKLDKELFKEFITKNLNKFPINQYVWKSMFCYGNDIMSTYETHARYFDNLIEEFQ